MEDKDDATNPWHSKHLPLLNILPGNEWTPGTSAIARIAVSDF
jgi:hypothetical protein